MGGARKTSSLGREIWCGAVDVGATDRPFPGVTGESRKSRVRTSVSGTTTDLSCGNEVWCNAVDMSEGCDTSFSELSINTIAMTKMAQTITSPVTEVTQKIGLRRPEFTTAVKGFSA